MSPTARLLARIALLLASTCCRTAGLQLGDGARDAGTVVELELYHVAFGQNRVSRDAIRKWAESSLVKLQPAVLSTINTWPFTNTPVTVEPAVVQKPSETRAGGSEEVFVEFHVKGMGAEDMSDDLKAAIRKAVTEAAGGSFGGANAQELVFKDEPGSHKKHHRRRDEAASGKGDPHLTNIHGERFDLYQPGVHALLQIPMRACPDETKLRVEADARRLGATCADLYFQVLNITGSWVDDSNEGSVGGLQFFADKEQPKMSWKHFGELDLKVVWGHLATGTVYLNFFVKHLARVQYHVGGLLGEDDHGVAATPGPECSANLDLHADGAAMVSSAEVAFEG